MTSSHPRTASGPMLWSFVLLVPCLIGVYTIASMAAERRSLGLSITAPWVPTLCFVGGTALLLIEGSICIAMALPVFLALASLGGLLAHAYTRVASPKQGTLNALLALPLLAGPVEAQLPLQDELARSAASIHIAATPEVVWGYINHAVQIQPAEMRGGLAYLIGLPYPQEAITQATASGGHVRKLRWDKHVAFDEPITDWEPQRYIRWTYDFKPDAFPPGALDEHVLIGGRYFDLQDTSYRLTPEAGGMRLDIEVHYRVSTHFNWYATRVGQLLVDDAAQAILRFYKHRSETTGSS
ncbi:MAG TPA: SRPBCC family protein [Ideonella sp.]|uniref:SRPBCC family protein n=1 Tax=Ideonella sp. TaxID=1929293 RepID=UPI002C66138C|nr:SRPBCC family protein [Ideonella sp.]HSI50880.1 SRPBCC family protein [Ideonella sp.]